MLYNLQPYVHHLQQITVCTEVDLPQKAWRNTPYPGTTPTNRNIVGGNSARLRAASPGTRCKLALFSALAP